MGDKHFTLLELHIDGDLQFGPKTMDLSSGEEPPDADGASIDVEGPDDLEDLDVEGGSGVGGLVAGFLVLIVVAVVLKKVLGGDDETAEEIDVE